MTIHMPTLFCIEVFIIMTSRDIQKIYALIYLQLNFVVLVDIEIVWL